MPPNTPQNSCFPARTINRTDAENLCFFHARFGAKARKCRAPCSWQPRNSLNLDDNINYRVASYFCRSRKKFLPTSQPLFYYPFSNMRFLLDTGAKINMIPPCRFYKPYYGPQDLIAANGIPIRIFGTKKLNIDVGARYTLRWTFKVAAVSLPIIGIDFMRHFGLVLDVANNAYILPRKSIYRRHHSPQTQSHHIPCISCPDANDAFDSYSTSPRLPDITDKFPLKRHTALETTNAGAANVVAHFINDLPKNVVNSPIINDDDVRLFFKSPKIRQ